MRKQSKAGEYKMRISFMGKYASFLLPALLAVSDYFAVLLAEGTAYYLRSNVLPLFHGEFVIPRLYFYVIVPFIFLCMLHMAHTHIRSMPFWKMAKNVFAATLYAVLLITMLMYFGRVSEVVSRLYVAMVWGFSFIFILGFRYLLKTYLNTQEMLQVPVLFIGAGKTAELVLRSFHHDTGFGFKVLGFIDDHPVSDWISQEFHILGGFHDIERIVRETGVQNVIITAPGLMTTQLLEIINRVQPCVRHISFVPDLLGMPVGNIEIESLVDEKIMMIKVRNNLASAYNRILKRIFDIVVSLVGLLVALPLGVLLAIAIYVDSPGPVVFAHRRVGRGGKEFPCYKFRTMVPNAETILRDYLIEHPEANREWQRDFKLKEDPRITRIGAFLRRTSLDELPQLINVLKGEMSLVGPRPIVRAEIVKYGEYIHDFYLVPPGITGMWQVNGRSDTTYEQRVEMDSWYVRNWSVWIDMVYLLKTVKVVLMRKGAY